MEDRSSHPALLSNLTLDTSSISSTSNVLSGTLPNEGHLSFDEQLKKSQWLLKKSLKEKRELELFNDQLRTQLTMV